MSEESDRALAIRTGCQLVLGRTAERAIAELLDAGWIPPKQRNEELRQMAEWQRDARRAFEAVEALAVDIDGPGEIGSMVAARLRDLLGDRFRTPEKAT